MAWALRFDGVNDYASAAVWVPTGDYRIKARFSTLSTKTGWNTVVSTEHYNDWSGVGIIVRGGLLQLMIFNSVARTIHNTGVTINDGIYHDVELIITADIKVYVDGALASTVQQLPDISNVPVSFGARHGNSGVGALDYLDVDIESIELIDDLTPLNYRHYSATTSSHAAGTPVLTDTVSGNNATGVNMPTDGSAWIDLGGGGDLTITAATPDYTYSSISAAIDLTGSIDVTANTPSYSYSSIDGGVDLTGEIAVTGTTANYLYSSQSATIDLTGDISITGVTPDYTYLPLPGNVSLDALLSVIGQTPVYNYNSVAASIDLTGLIDVVGETSSFSYSPIKGRVSTGEQQEIGVVGAGFAKDKYLSDFGDDVYTSGFKPSVITVNFKT